MSEQQQSELVEAIATVAGAPGNDALWDRIEDLAGQLDDPESVARACVALLSDWFPKTTGEIVHVDGGFHAMGA